MDHVAIMNPKWNLIEKILSGEKTIESRWSKNKIAPWGKVKVGEIIYFKNSGKCVIAMAEVEKVIQFENLDSQKIRMIVKDYGGKGKIALADENMENWAKGKNYCVLVWLKNAKKITPFMINKSGYGTGASWLCTKDIAKISIY